MRPDEPIQRYLDKVEDVMAKHPGRALNRELLEEVKVHYVAGLLHGNWKRHARKISRRDHVMQNFTLFIEMLRETDVWQSKKMECKPVSPDEESIGSNEDSHDIIEGLENEVNSPEDPYEEPTEESDTKTVELPYFSDSASVKRQGEAGLREPQGSFEVDGPKKPCGEGHGVATVGEARTC